MKEIIPTDVILPEGTRSLIAWDPAEQEYWRAGPEARSRVKLGGDSIGDSATYPPGSLRFHVTKEFVVDYNDGVRIAPLKRTRVIGDFFILDDHHASCPPALYKTCFRSTLVFDMSSGRGVWTKVAVDEGIIACERFDDSDEGNLSSSHYELAADVEGARRRHTLALDKSGFADMFLYRTDDGLSYDVTRVFGHMERQALSDAAISGFAATFAERVKEALSDDDLKALADGLALRSRIFNKPLTPLDEAYLQAAAAGPVSGSGVVVGNAVGGPILPVNLEFPQGLPPGFGTIAGIRTLANAALSGNTQIAQFPDLASTAIRFDEALNKLYDVVSTIFRPNHPVLDASNVPAYFASGAAGADKLRQDSITTFAQNVLTGNVLPLYVAQAVGDAAEIPVTLSAADIAEQLELTTREPAEQAQGFAVSIRGLLDRAGAGLSPQARSVFSNARSFGEFAADFKQSSLASASIDALRSQQPLQARDTSFGFFVQQLVAANRVPTDAAAATLINNVVSFVNAPDRRVDSRTVGRLLESWINVRDVLPGSSAPAANQRLSRLAVSFAQLQRANINSDSISVASPFDVTKRVTLAEAAALEQDSTVNAAVLSVAAARSLGGDAFAVERVGAKRKLAANAFDGGERALPSFARDYLFDASTEQRSPAADGTSKREGVLTINTNLALRYQEAAQNEKNALSRIGAQMLLLAPITRAQLLSFCRHDVRVPVAILAERPLQSWQTASLIFGRGGRELGEIAYAQLDVSLGANALTKTFSFNVSFWVAPVVRHPEFTYIAEDVIITGYIGGMTTVPFTRTSQIDSLERTDESVYYLMVPYGSLIGNKGVRATHDIRGRFDTDIIQGRLTRTAHETLVRAPQHPSALYYNDVFGFGGFKPDAISSGDFQAYTSNHQNTVVHRTHQWLYNHVTGQFSQVLLNTGHFGPNMYEGLGDLLTMGSADHYKQMNYEANAVPI